MIRDESTNIVVVWMTLPSGADPAEFARVLVNERLAACVTTIPRAASVYRWNSEVEEATEHHLTIKTTTECLERLERRAVELHPYDVPEFLVLQVKGGLPAYLQWVNESTAPASPASPSN